MIELRWLEKTQPPEHEGATGFYYKVLQYRYPIAIEKIPDIGKVVERIKSWSEWIDVPTVPTVTE